MMMNRTRPMIVLLLIAAAQGHAFAQNGYKRVHDRMLEEARVLLGAGDFLEAAKIYKRLLPVDTLFADVYYELGQCYMNMPGQRKQSDPLFERAARLGHPEALFELGGVRHRQERFDEAIALYTTYKSITARSVTDAEVQRRINACRSAKELVASPVAVRVRNMGTTINSSAHDYCPLVTGDGNTLYFTSRREGSTGSRKDASGQAFEDIYVAQRVGDHWSRASNAGIPLNTNVHDATVGLSADGQHMIIYRTAPNLNSGDLYECRREGDMWQVPELMTERINGPAHEPSATISPDGREIYFTSDRAGGFGGRDLYRIRRLPNGEWSMPLNLGPQVNSSADEDAPFMHSDGVTLFFSSNGRNTMGGYDIFKTVLIDPDMNGWSAPENMGYPLNTVNDDIYFSLSEDGVTGYFSSERPGGLGAQDIYEVVFSTSQTNHLIVRGVVTDKREEPVHARITLTNEEGDEVIGVYNTNARTGRYIMVVPPNTRYRMRVEADGFEQRDGDLDATGRSAGNELPLDITLVRNETTARANLKP